MDKLKPPAGATGRPAGVRASPRASALFDQLLGVDLSFVSFRFQVMSIDRASALDVSSSSSSSSMCSLVYSFVSFHSHERR